jgi:hypothetical protein
MVRRCEPAYSVSVGERKDSGFVEGEQKNTCIMEFRISISSRNSSKTDQVGKFINQVGLIIGKIV